MTDELDHGLAKVEPPARVISRTFRECVQRPQEGPAEIAGIELDRIVEGFRSAVGKTACESRPKLLHAPTDKHLWAESYELDLGDVLRLQSEVARTI